jgi:hypothetical protein
MLPVFSYRRSGAGGDAWRVYNDDAVQQRMANCGRAAVSVPLSIQGANYGEGIRVDGTYII